MSRSASFPAWAAMAISVVALVASTAAITMTVVARSPGTGTPATMMGGATSGMMAGGATRVMGGGGGMMGGLSPTGTTQPGTPGFVAGTTASPRVIPVTAGPGDAFSPSSIAVARGETVTFLVTTMGPTLHEFMVGPADAVAADTAGTPEVADIGMMQTKSLTVTFDGPGPYAYACHEAGHYEAGMRGTITIIG
jgi:uncharacterized cupredoxin-like copper-binding protein